LAFGGNPIWFSDVNGDDAKQNDGDYFDKNGNHIRNDGVDDGKIYITDNNVDHEIPSILSLKTSIEVLKKTKSRTKKDKDGGLHGESAIVYHMGIVSFGESGEKAYIKNENGNNYFVADEKLPELLDFFKATSPIGGSKIPIDTDDVESSIHSHMTSVLFGDNDQFFSHDTEPSERDETTFKQFKFNIIVGPKDKLHPYQITKNKDTNKYESKTQRTNVISIYDRNSKLIFQLKESSLKKIIKYFDK
jgi:hypothetical protein